jgi:hypothetical protein
MRLFYILMGVVAIAGIALLGATLLQNRQTATTAPTPAGRAPEAPSVPTGRTADGFYYKGNPDAKVIVTEYGDYQ